jgi:hypothetical protein
MENEEEGEPFHCSSLHSTPSVLTWEYPKENKRRGKEDEA